MWLGTAARIQAKRRSLTWSLALGYQIRTRVAAPWPALKRGLAGPSDAEAQRRLVEFGNEVEEVAHEALLLMFREVRRFVPSPPYHFLRLTPTFWCCEAYDAFCVSLSKGSIAPEIDLPAQCLEIIARGLDEALARLRLHVEDT